jgi:hypothetical protein
MFETYVLNVVSVKRAIKTSAVVGLGLLKARALVTCHGATNEPLRALESTSLQYKFYLSNHVCTAVIAMGKNAIRRPCQAALLRAN